MNWICFVLFMVFSQLWILINWSLLFVFWFQKAYVLVDPLVQFVYVWFGFNAPVGECVGLEKHQSQVPGICASGLTSALEVQIKWLLFLWSLLFSFSELLVESCCKLVHYERCKYFLDYAQLSPVVLLYMLLCKDSWWYYAFWKRIS